MSHLNSTARRLAADADAPSAQEKETTRFWEYVFTRLIFKDETWIVSSQQSPTRDPNDRRRVDLMIEKATENGFSRLLYLEAKRVDATQTDLTEVEYQGFTAGAAHCEAFNQNSISIITCAGSRARLWIYRRGDDYLTALFPAGVGMGLRDEYVSVNSPDGNELINKLKYLRNHNLPAPSSTIPSNCSPRPTNVSLPAGWDVPSTTPSYTGSAPYVQGSSAYPYVSYAQGSSSNIGGSSTVQYMSGGANLGASTSGQPTEWSEWAWLEAAGYWSRYRLDARGEYEYENRY